MISAAARIATRVAKTRAVSARLMGGAAAHHHHDDNLPPERLPTYKVLDDKTIEVTVPPYFDEEDGEEWEVFTAYDRKEDLPNERRFKLCLKGPEMPRKFLTPISQKDMDVSMVNDRSLYTKAVVPVLADSLEWLLECPPPTHTFDEQPFCVEVEHLNHLDTREILKW